MTITDEIAELIERIKFWVLKEGQTYIDHPVEYAFSEIAIEVAAALERMARENERQKESLIVHAREIQLLFKRIRELEALAKCDSCGKPFDENGGICEPCHSSAIGSHIKPLGERIRELEAENERLRYIDGGRQQALARIRELEAERDAFQALNKSLLAHNGELLRDLGASTDTIRAKTIEECAKLFGYPPDFVAEAIRALKPSETGEWPNCPPQGES